MTAKLDVPEYELTSYEPVTFSMPRPEVSDEQVAAQMREMAERVDAGYVDSGRTLVGAKDDVEFDLEVKRDGELIENLSSEGRMYTVGAGLMPIGFDRGVLGMEVGQTKEFEFEAPDIAEGTEGQEHTFTAKVTVRRIVDKVAPTLDDAWVAKHMPARRDLAGFREYVRENLREAAEQTSGQERHARAVQALSERFKGSIDDRLYEEARARMMAGYEQQARMQGMDLQDFIGKQGMDDNQFSMMVMMQVRNMLVERFSLDAWARHYGIEASEADMRELADMMSQGNADAFLERVGKDAGEKAAFEMAAQRYAANKDLVAKATITVE